MNVQPGQLCPVSVSLLHVTLCELFSNSAVACSPYRGSWGRNQNPLLKGWGKKALQWSPNPAPL